MSIDFRCENCGKLLSVEADAGSSTKCPHCGKKVPVPAAVASLPRPKVAPNAAPPPPDRPNNPETAPAHSEEAHEPAHDSEVMTTMAAIMPWIISVFFHVGVAMILLFATMMVQGVTGQNGEGEGDDVIVPDAAWSDEPGGSLVESKNKEYDNSRPSTVARSEYAKRDTVADSGLTAKRAALSVAGGLNVAVGGGSGKGDMLGLKGGGGGPKSSLFGKGGNAHHVVYLIDRSGSMLDYFDYVRREMLNSIGKLKPVQDFHVVFFNAGQPLENPPQQLVAATPEYRQQAAEFLAGIRPELTTNPLPAMKRAFEVLDKADPKKKGRLLYMLTDGAFPDNDAVTKFFKQVNPTSKADRVHVCTFLYGKQPKDVAAFMEQLAKDNGGNFKIITEDE